MAAVGITDAMSAPMAVTSLVAEVIVRVPAAAREGTIIFGSAAIVLNDVELDREVGDLDLFASADGFDALKPYALSVDEKISEVHRLRLAKDIEVFMGFPGVQHSEVLVRARPRPGSQGILVASVVDLIAWKRAQGREKDLRDLLKLEAARGR